MNKSPSLDTRGMLSLSNFKIPPEKATIKRLMDIFFSFILIALTAPIMSITALLIKLTSKGPVFYKQVRLTKDQKAFEIIKFRSMRVDAEKLSGPIFARPNDPRVTKIGKYLRSLRIDELPQLFNVLKGEMSLIGPRPERPYFVEQFKEQNPYYYLRYNVRAGMTGYAQAYGKNGTAVKGKLTFDLLYIKNYSFTLDIRILFQTAKLIIATLIPKRALKKFPSSNKRKNLQ